MHSGSVATYDDLTFAELKEKVKEDVRKAAKGVTAISLIKTARTQSQQARILENQGDLKAALGPLFRAGILTHMFMNSTEFLAENKPGRHGALYKEFVDFQKTEGNNLIQRVQAIEAKLAFLEKSAAIDDDGDAGSSRRVGNSIADRVRKLNDAGLAVAKPSINSLASSALSSKTSPVPEKPVIPASSTIPPELLHQYLYAASCLKILMVDIRTREEFDNEHIKADAMVSLEPSVLARPSVTAPSLEDSLFAAPREEWVLFQNRDKFDLVVLYDASSEAYDAASPLSAFVRAIFDNAFRKFLRHSPVLLVGGLQAWKEMFPDEVVRGVPGRARRSPNSIPKNGINSTSGLTSRVPLVTQYKLGISHVMMRLSKRL